MALCKKCRRVDFDSLIHDCLRQRHDRQAEYYNHIPPTRALSGWPFIKKRHRDILEVKKCAPECHLCQVIFQAFKQIKHMFKDPEDARGLPLVLRPYNNKIQVCYASGGGPIGLCNLDLYMDDANVTELFRTLGIKENDRPPILKKMNTDPGSDSSLATASSWLQNCLSNHSLCQPPLEFQNPPKRLINVGNTSQNPFLAEMGPDSPPVKWLCLSYCWGGVEPAVKLTRANMEKLKSGLLSAGETLESLDATVRDAILVARALDIPYIWIDALCILQDKETNDWNEQAPKMNEIYGGSVLTLVAASAKTVKDGFLTKRRLQYAPIALSDTPSGESRGKVFLSPEWPPEEDSTNGPWKSRGWTMQEGLLPNRLLYYTSSQMMWKCNEEERFERGVTKRLDTVQADARDPESKWLETSDIFLKFKWFPHCITTKWLPLRVRPEMFGLWYYLVEDYSRRQFTDPGDRLVAVSGLAKVFGDTIRSDKYFAGLWKQDMIRGLMWYTEGATLIPPKPLDNNMFPTWSWASAGRRHVKFDHDRRKMSLTRMERVQVDLVDKRQPFGPLKTGRTNTIILTGPLKRLPRLYNKEWRREDASMSELERYLSETIDRESSWEMGAGYSPPSGVHFAALQMLQGFEVTPSFVKPESLDLLILESTGEAPNNVYRRFGVLTLRIKELVGDIPTRRWENEVHSKVLFEVRRENWKEKTVIII
ncbi:heterokaryon incompatibility protein-domain-containing protein [Chaetomium sp. MPI-CAGE-AT-0009]|nr:heterokaryon incompatibility protein-domain-containing protein [Chaetomium sp. MPI-CAGE-AT-0009]